MRIFGDELRCGAKGRRFFPIFGSWLKGRTVAVVGCSAANGGTLRACRFPVRATDLKWMISHTHFQTSRTGRAREKLRDFLRFSVTLCSNG